MTKASLAIAHLGLPGAFDIDSIREFRRSIDFSTTQRLQSLQRAYVRERKRSKQLAANPVVRSFFDDEITLAESIQDLADQLAIVALYGELEIQVKHMCRIAIPGIDGDCLFRWANLKKAVGRAGIRLERLRRYNLVNQLRCLNNAIKHSRKVGTELAATGWGALGDPIDAKRCSAEFENFASGCESFVADLRVRLLKLI